IGISKDFNNFELQKAIGQRDTLKANRIVHYYKNNINKHPMVLTLAMLYAFFAKIMLLHSLKDRSQDNLKAKLGVHPFFIKDYSSAARVYSPAKLTRIFGWLREYDLRSKGVNNSSTGHGELLQELVFKITHI
ncbi:MAG: DNA polymerase III subunit delta, partial [Bacteroidia bacterium]|nr:DNA polymerase III subunit delta [Bacteroidia bacterium]